MQAVEINDGCFQFVINNNVNEEDLGLFHLSTYKIISSHGTHFQKLCLQKLNYIFIESPEKVNFSSKFLSSWSEILQSGRKKHNKGSQMEEGHMPAEKLLWEATCVY